MQLTAVACMLIAAKQEETDRIPTIKDLTNIADNCFQVPELGLSFSQKASVVTLSAHLHPCFGCVSRTGCYNCSERR